MNHIYRLIFSKRLGCIVVAAENSKGLGKSGSKAATVGAVMAPVAIAVAAIGAGGGAWADTTIDNATVTSRQTLNSSSGNFTVTPTGKVLTNATAVNIDNSQTITGSILNQGTISSRYSYGVFIHTASSLTGGVTNTGSLQGSQGLEVYNHSTVGGALVNAGQINAITHGVILDLQSTVGGGITNTGQIKNDGTSRIVGYQNAGVMVNDLSNVGNNISNSGTIVVVGYDSYTGAGISLNKGSVQGSIVNSGSITGYRAIEVHGSSISDSILNSGTAQGGKTGIRVLSGSSLTGGIVNQGLVAGFYDALSIRGSTVAGGLTNSGVLNVATVTGQAPGHAGIEVNQSHIDNNVLNTGTITGVGETGISIVAFTTVTGSVINQGSISAVNGDGIQVSNSTVNQRLSNLGTINAGHYGVVVTGRAVVNSVTNAGRIKADWTGVSMIGSTVTGSVVNNGTIQGVPGVAVWSSTIQGAVLNTGSIAAGGSHGIVLWSASRVNGGISNTGTISAAQTGIKIDATSSVNGGITSTGLISGAAAGINNAGIVSATQSGINVQGGTVTGIFNSGSISGGAWSSGAVRINHASIAGAIVNNGAIAAGNGIMVVNGSSVSNGITNHGSIVGAYSSGIGIQGSSLTGGIVNTGSIAGATYAVNYRGSNVSGNLVNSGTLAGGYEAFWMYRSTVSGVLDNSGSMQGGLLGVGVSNSVINGVTNSGKIAGTGSNAAGIRLWSYGTVAGNIENTGTIAGGKSGIGAYRGSVITGSISNTGTIDGGAQGINLIGGAKLVGNLVNNGGISGASIGLSVGGLHQGTQGGSIQGFVQNAGTIAGGQTGIKIDVGSAINGGIVSTGLISGATAGINNAGNIAGSNLGIFLNSGAQVSGDITNSGTISGARRTGIGLWTGSTVTGSIVNSGSISGGTSGVGVWGNSKVTGAVINSGTIAAGYSDGINVNRGTVMGGISNSGMITALVGMAVQSSAYLGTLGASGNAMVNSGTISASYAGMGFWNAGGTVAGDVVNQGAITSGNRGINVSNGTVLAHRLINTGTVSAVNYAAAVINATVTGGITNSGSMAGGKVGLFIDPSLITGDVVNSGTLNGGQHGFHLLDSTVTGKLTNSGTILGDLSFAQAGQSGYGVYLQNSALPGGIDNSGSICGANGGLSVDASGMGGLVNTGTICGPTGTIAGAAVQIKNSTLSAGISNSGMVSGGDAALSLVGSVVNGALVNSGTILGAMSKPGSFGLNMVGSTLTGGIDNSGSICGADTGVNLGAGANGGALTNSGVICGGRNAISTVNRVEGTATGALASITQTGSGQFVGDIAAPASTMTVRGTMNQINAIDVAALNIAAGGTLNYLSGTKVGDARVPGISVGAGSGTLSNAGTLNVGTQTLTLDGNLTNTGTIVSVLSGDTLAGRIAATGNVSLAGVYNFSITAKPASKVLNLISGSSLAGEFSSVNLTSGTYRFKTQYTTTSFNLIFAPDPFARAAALARGNGPAVDAGRVIDSLIDNPGKMSGVIDTTSEMSQADISARLSQTLPTLVGAGSKATADSMHTIDEIVQARQSVKRDMGTGAEAFQAERDVWLRAFGNWGNQGDVSGVSGYKINASGVMLGIDRERTGRQNVGAYFGIGSNSLSSTSAVAPSSLKLSSHFLGIYGDHGVEDDLDANVSYRLDLGVHENTSARSLSLFQGVTDVTGTTASARYNSTSWHAGVAYKKVYKLDDTSRLIPTLKLDYFNVSSQGYQESGAGALNLAVGKQRYEQTLLGADLRYDNDLRRDLRLSLNAGVAYDLNNAQVKTTSQFEGGGDAFAVDGMKVSPWKLNLGAGLSGQIDKDTQLLVRYDVRWSPNQGHTQGVSAKLRWNF